MTAADFFDLPPSLAAFAGFFPPDVPPWEWINRIGRALESLRPADPGPAVPAGVRIEGPVRLDPTVRLPAYAVIAGPAWIGPGCEIRAGAVLRGKVIAGANCVLGHACEFKNCLLLDRVQAPHFNYVGDSVLGSGSHLAAGAICSNLRLDEKPIVVRSPEGEVETGLRKFGAIVGEGAQVGCNSVLNPGTLLGKGSMVGPVVAFGGYLAPRAFAKSPKAAIVPPAER